jgi:hypothetical protein
MSKKIINGRRTNGKVDRTGGGQICMLGMRELAAEGTPYQQKESEEARATEERVGERGK